MLLSPAIFFPPELPQCLSQVGSVGERFQMIDRGNFAAHPAKIVPEKLRFQHSVVRIIEKCEAAASQSLFRIPPSLSAGFGKVIGCYFRKQCRILAVVAGGKTANRPPISLQRDRGCPFRQKCRHGVIVESVITPLDAVGEVSCDEHLRSRGFLRENCRRDLLQQQAVLFQTVPQKIDVAVLPAICQMLQSISGSPCSRRNAFALEKCLQPKKPW